MNPHISKVKSDFFKIYESALADLERLPAPQLVEIQRKSNTLRESNLFSERVAGEVLFTASTNLLEILQPS